MGRKMLNKLHSRKGASLTFALLAFLVCAVISAVLLASASAAAGRASGLAEMDQRYYAVTSAAQLFCDALDEQSFIIERTRNVPYTQTTTVTSVDGLESTFIGEVDFGTPTYSVTVTFPSETEYKDNAIPSAVIGQSIMAEAALYYVIGDSVYNTSYSSMNDLVGSTFEKPVGNGKTWDFELKVSDPEGEKTEIASVLAVNVQFTMDNSGNIVILFQNQQSNATDPVYKIEVTLKATPSHTDNTVVIERTIYNNYVEYESGISYDIVTETTEKTEKNTSISWEVADVKKVTA